MSAAQLGPPARRFASYCLDLDGTVYLGEELLPAAGSSIAALRAAGSRVVFVTNKPLDSAADYAAKLNRLGVPAVAEDVVTALDSLVGYLTRQHPGARVLTVAEPLVDNTLAAAGFPLTERPDDAQVVVVSFDRTFDYAKLTAAFLAVRSGAVLVATNPDPWCPTPQGGLPDCAALLAAVEVSSGRTAEAVVGKPSQHMAQALLHRLGSSAADAVVVGDRLSTDIAMGRTVGIASALVLTGATSRSDLQAALAAGQPAPDYVLTSLADLLPAAPQTSQAHPAHPARRAPDVDPSWSPA